MNLSRYSKSIRTLNPKVGIKLTLEKYRYFVLSFSKLQESMEKSGRVTHVLSNNIIQDSEKVINFF